MPRCHVVNTHVFRLNLRRLSSRFSFSNDTVEALLTDTLVRGKFYLRPPSQNVVFKTLYFYIPVSGQTQVRTPFSRPEGVRLRASIFIFFLFARNHVLNAKPLPNRHAVDRCNVIIFVFARSICSISEFRCLKGAGRSLKERLSLYRELVLITSLFLSISLCGSWIKLILSTSARFLKIIMKTNKLLRLKPLKSILSCYQLRTKLNSKVLASRQTFK